MIGLVIIFFLMLLFSAFFSCSESAMLSVSRMQLQRMVKQKRMNAHLVEKLKEDPHRLLATILIGNNIVNITAAAISTMIAIEMFGDAAIGIAAAITTVLVILFGEIIPKSIGVSHATTISTLFAPILYGLRWIMTPLIYIVDNFTKLFTRLFGEPEKETVTQEEIQDVIRASEHDGHLKAGEREMIQNVLKLDDRSADEVMTPRLDVFCLEMHKKISEVMETIIAEGFSRVPVYDTKMDQMRGVVIVKDLLVALKEGKTHLTLQELMQPILVIPENKKLDSILREFQRKKAVMAVVVDEHGLFIGVITIEDVLEELVGEIYDENDVFELAEVQKLEPNVYLVNGKTIIGELNEELGFGIPETDDYDTLAGFVLHRFGRIPKPGEETRFGHLRLIVEKAAQHRVISVKIIVEEKSHKEHVVEKRAERVEEKRPAKK